MKFSDKPTCHGSPRLDPIAWRTRTQQGALPEGLPGAAPGPDAPNPFRSCNYCGSMNTEDLINALRGGAKMSGSDWKYGYPHKFYVTEIPNPHPDTQVLLGYAVGGRDESGGVRGIRNVVWRPSGLLHSKFYSEHLLDEGFDDEALDLVCRALHVHTGILFSIKDDKLAYSAPHHGYQR